MHEGKPHRIGQQLGEAWQKSLTPKMKDANKVLEKTKSAYTDTALNVLSFVPIPGFAGASMVGKGVRALIKSKAVSKLVQKFLPKTKIIPQTSKNILSPSGSYVPNQNLTLARDYNPNTKEIRNIFVDKEKVSKMYRAEDVNQGAFNSSSQGAGNITGNWYDEVKHTVTQGFYNNNVKNAINTGENVSPDHLRRVISVNVTENYKNIQRAGGFKKASKLSGGKGNLPLYNEIIADPVLTPYIRKQGVIKNNPNKIARTFIGPKAEVKKLYDNPLFLKTKK